MHLNRVKTVIRWAVVGKDGLYIGQHFTRNHAIAEHVYMFDKKLHKSGKQWAFGALDQYQKRAWAQRKKKGDRAVKVLIIYPV